MQSETSGGLGGLDRVIRVVIGLILLGFAFFCPWAAELGSAVQWISGIVGGILVATAAMRFCPIYRAMGICS